MARWFGAKRKLPPNVVQLSDAPVDEFGEPNWNGEIEAKTRGLGSDFLAAFLFEVSPGMCIGGYLARAQYQSPVRNYDATAVLVTRKNDELQTIVSIAAPACQNEGRQWPPYANRHSASLPKEHVPNLVHTLRGLCEQAHAQELLKTNSMAVPDSATRVVEEVEDAQTLRQMNGFAEGEFIVYPVHGVGQILAIEHQIIAGAELDFFVISFARDKMTLRVPAAKIENVGVRKLSSPSQINVALSSLNGCAASLEERANQYADRINSGDIVDLAHVVRELRPSPNLEELYKAALARLSQEIAAARGLDDTDAVDEIEKHLSTVS